MMNLKQNAPFRADVIGSFLRPERLKEAREKFFQKLISHEELKQVEDEEIKKLVHKQQEVGLKVATDGEFRRSYWHLDFFWGFDGVEHNIMKQGYLFHGEETRADSARLNGKIRFTNHPFLEHFKFLQSIISGDVVARQTIPAPSQFYAELLRGENEEKVNEYYPNRNDLLEDIAAAYRAVILEFYKLGCRNIQLDDCTWGMLCDKNFWQTMANGDYNPNSLQEIYLNLNNKAIENLPEDLIVNTHVCRGNYHSTWATSGGYEPIAENLFGKEKVSAYYLEFDTDRAGGFEPLQYVSSNKKVVLGLITSKFPQLEDKTLIKERIKEASKFVPLDHLCLSPQCGFASTEEGNILTEEEQWKKIALVCEVAQEVWGK
nr:5-methyltetrahydropteroyltriglutamate--homocysteine S-methyltransferase [Dysgonomonas capnocytophagoides]